MFVLFKKLLLATILLVAISLGLILTPWGLTRLSNHVGASYLFSVEHVGLTLMPFGLRLQNAQLGQGEGALKLSQLDLGLHWQKLSDGVVALTIVGDRMSVGYQGDQLKVAGLTLPQWRQQVGLEDVQKEDTQPLDATSLSSTSPTLQIPSFRFNEILLQSEQTGWPDVAIRQLKIGGINTASREQASSLSTEVHTAQGQILLSGYFSPLAQKPNGVFDINLQQLQPNTNWLKFVPDALKSGQIDARLNTEWQLEGYQSKVSLQGDLSLKNLHWKTVTDELRLAELQLQTVLKQHNTPAFEFDLKTSARLSHLNWETLTEKLQLSSLQADQLTLDPHQLRIPSIEAQQLDLTLMNGLEVDYHLEQLQLSTLALKGWSAPDSAELSLASVVLGPQNYQQRLSRSPDQQLVLKSQALALSNLSLKPERLHLLNANIQQLLFTLRAETDTEPPLSENHYSLQQIGLETLDIQQWQKVPQITLNQLTLTDGTLNWQHNKKLEGAVTRPEQASTQQQPVSSADVSDNPMPSTSSESLSLQLRQLNLLRQKILYQDHNLSRPTQSELQLESFELKGLNWPSGQAAQWTLEAWLDGQSQWLLAGDWQSKPMAFSAHGQQKGLSLPSISPYTEQLSQVYFQQGVMDNQISLSLKDQHLQGKIGFLFHQLEMSLKGDFASQNLPLKLALSVLEDSDDRIELDIGIDKKGEQLKINSGDLIREFVLSASQKGALSYLKYTLQPFGSLMTLKSLSEGLLKGGSIPLEPVVFEPLQAELSPQQKAYAEKIGSILKARDNLKLASCLRSSEQEYQQLLVLNKGDVKLSQSALLTLEQARLRQWLRVIAAQGRSSQLKACELSAQALSEQGVDDQAMLILKLAP